MRDDVLDDPALLAVRKRFWTAALTDERFRDNRIAVAERGGHVIGVPCPDHQGTPMLDG